MTEFNKFGVIGLLHFHNEIRPCHSLNFPLQACWERGAVGGRKKGLNKGNQGKITEIS